MTARDDYHHAYDNRHRCGLLGAQDLDAAMDEIDRLRYKVEVLTAVLADQAVAESDHRNMRTRER